MPQRKIIHVVRIEGLQWVIQIEGVPDIDAQQTFPSREQAIVAGTEKAKQEKVELIIHRRGGGICRHSYFGNAPRDIQG